MANGSVTLKVRMDTSDLLAQIERVRRTLEEPTPIFDRLVQESSGSLAFRQPGDQSVLPGQPLQVRVGTRVVTDDSLATTRHADHRPSVAR